jgi:hypothetical protein
MKGNFGKLELMPNTKLAVPITSAVKLQVSQFWKGEVGCAEC